MARRRKLSSDPKAVARRAGKAIRAGELPPADDPDARRAVRNARRRARKNMHEGTRGAERMQRDPLAAAVEQQWRAGARNAPGVNTTPTGSPKGYRVRVDYRRKKGSEQVAELRLIPPGGRPQPDDVVKRAVVNAARGQVPKGWRVVRLDYGTKGGMKRSRAIRKDTVALGGVLGDWDSITDVEPFDLTIGEEASEDENG